MVVCENFKENVINLLNLNIEMLALQCEFFDTFSRFHLTKGFTTLKALIWFLSCACSLVNRG